jgi:uncharacterized membrane protein YgcG
MTKKILANLWVMIALCIPFNLAYSQDASADKILSFQSDIRLELDGSMTVTESITVYAGNDYNIKHGIYRDFPTRYRDLYRNTLNVEFNVVRVLRDGETEPYHIEAIRNGKRVYIGSGDKIVARGVHVYSITYETDRQIGFFKDFDELYWNVTGNGWDFAIETAQATITLPGEISGRIRSYEAYTGPAGAKLKDYSAFIDDSGRIVFTATKPLAPAEGLTIAITWPKGYIAEPPFEKKALYYVRDNVLVVTGLLGFALLTGYYLFVWSLFGRDPVKGTIIPLFKPPENITPQAARYIMKMSYDAKIFGCAVINMAVKGFLTIQEENSVFTLKKTGAGSSNLSADEQEIAKVLLSENEIVLDNARHSAVSSAIQSLKYFLKNNYEKVYFLTNIKYFVPGIVISAVMLVAGVFIQAGPDLPVAIFMSVWLTFWSFGVFFLMIMVVSAWKGYLNSYAKSAFLLGQAVFISLFFVPFAFGELFGISMLVSATGIAVLPFLALFVLTNLFFYHLLKAPTLAGRRVMDKIEGFKMYLGTAEKDRLNSLYGADITPEIFERYLPYALALGVEQAWAEKFASVLHAAGKEGAQYHPAWYSGAAWGRLGAAGFASTLGSSVSGAISSASHAPGSSSGSGGGGSSGGGGGGGGGGGW